jgi:hypothetical protein
MFVMAAGFFIVIVSTDQAIAWHSQFESKKDCVEFMKNVLGNSTREANVMCVKIVPH